MKSQDSAKQKTNMNKPTSPDKAVSSLFKKSMAIDADGRDPSADQHVVIIFQRASVISGESDVAGRDMHSPLRMFSWTLQSSLTACQGMSKVNT
jgi:hypothetical protein